MTLNPDFVLKKRADVFFEQNQGSKSPVFHRGDCKRWNFFEKSCTELLVVENSFDLGFCDYCCISATTHQSNQGSDPC